MIRKWFPAAAVLIVLLLITGACFSSTGNASGLPANDGSFPVQGKSVSYDGNAYQFIWFDAEGKGHQARSGKVQLQQDDRTFLQVVQGGPVLHLAGDEPVRVSARDHQGSFTSSWFPFMVGYGLGSLGGGPPVVIGQPGSGQTSRDGPAYRYPPTDGVTRDGTAYGSTASARPQTIDLDKAKAAPNAVSGKNDGTGGGTAATNKSSSAPSGQSGGTGTGTAASGKSASSPSLSGQSGGTGAGTAASGKSSPSIGKKASSGIFGGGGSRLSSGFGGGRRR